MIFTAHRINTIDELMSIPTEFGVEIDIRNYGDKLILSHDPYDIGEDFEDFIKEYNHSFIILNVKCERIEHKILEMISKYKIKDYFLLDCSFPMIYKLSNEEEKNIAIRYSEFESVQNSIIMKNRVKWVWIDSFENLTLNSEKYKILKDCNFNICVVSPELQNKNTKIEEYANIMLSENIIPDMICTKIYNVDRWKKMFI